MVKIHYAGLCLGGLLLVSSCVDDKYDLSDIDTTTAIKLDGLVLPVKLSEITLDEVLDIEKETDGLIGEYTDKNGHRYYAIKQEGSFSADPVKIDELHLKDPVSVPKLTIPAVNGHVDNATVDFSYRITNVDPALLYFSYFGLKESDPMEINLSVSPADVSITDLVIQIPSSYIASYNGKEYTDGIIPVEVENGKLKYPICVTQMIFDPVLSNIDNTLTLGGKIGLKSATVNTNGNSMELQFSMSPFTANVVSGGINYTVQTPYLNPVELGDLPDFLTSGETNLVLQNPQIYLNFSSLFGAYYNTGITIQPLGNEAKETYIRLDPFQTAIVLAPNTNDLGLPNLYDSAVLQNNVTQLQTVLSGKGLPNALDIQLDEETFLKGNISNLMLGTDEGISLGGGYTFFTPLALGADSQIIYSKTENNFFGDDMEDVLVSELQLSANVTTNLPFAVTLSVYPLDKDGNKLDHATATVPAEAQGSLLDIHFTNPFKGLDGVEFTITANDMNGESLTPEQYLKLDNIKAKVSGEYVTKL